MNTNLSKSFNRTGRRGDVIRRLIRGIMLMLIAGLAGCGPDGPAMEPVTGVVRHNGKPVAGARVTFIGPTSPRAAVGTTNDAGEFSLTTMTDGDGAVVGEHKVTVTSFTPEALAKMSNAQQEALGRGEKVRGSSLPTAYASYDKTSLSAVVVADGENHFEFDLSD